MNVTVAFTTQLKAAIGMSEQTITLPDSATVDDALKHLATLHPQPFGDLVLSDGELLPSILMSLNDQQVDQQVALADGDVLTLLSAISGG